MRFKRILNKYSEWVNKTRSFIFCSSTVSNSMKSTHSSALAATYASTIRGTLITVSTCFVMISITNILQTEMCMFRWDRPHTWVYTFALTGSPMCRMLSQTNTFFHRTAGSVLGVIF